MSKVKRAPLAQGILSNNNYEPINYQTRNITPPPNLTNKDEDNRSTPRRGTPQKTSIVSPPQSENELSLSDTDVLNGYSESQRRRAPSASEVLVTETIDSGLGQSGEVQMRSFTIKSPVKVIRHSPSRSDTDLLHENSEENSKSSTGNSLDETYKSAIQKGSLSQTSVRKKKKKKYVEVPSRFKQAIPNRKEDEKFQSFDMSAILPNNNSRQRTSSGHQRSSSGSKKPSRVTSTPFLMTSSYEKQLPATDGSILNQTRFQNEPIIKQPMVKKTKLKKQKPTKKDDLLSRDTAIGNEGSNAIEKEQLMVDLYNARLCQMSYLKMKAQHTLEKQEEKAKRELYALWVLNQRIQKENDAIKLSIETRNIEVKVDQLIQYQMKGFEPLQEKISKLLKKLNSMGETLTNTSHLVLTDNLTISSEDNLVKSLDESKRLLGEINGLTRKEYPQIEELSTASEALMKTIKLEFLENQRCGSLLKSCNRLLNHERSLQAHLLEIT